MNTCAPMCACVRVLQGRTQRSMYPGKRSENTHLVCVCSCRVVLRVPPPLVHTAPHVAQAVIGDCEGSGEAEGDLLHPLAPQVRGVQGDLLRGVVGARRQRHQCATLPSPKSPLQRHPYTLPIYRARACWGSGLRQGGYCMPTNATVC